MILNKWRRQIIYCFFLIAGLLGLEILLRSCYGFCDAVLIREDNSYEYIAQANQNRFRFGNHVIYNSHSMRSEEVDTASTIILGFGDSVINGGVQTEQDSLATHILSNSFSKLNAKKTQFLNISAGSWGPDNCYAYLKKHGNFGTFRIYLFVSSHDAYDNMSFGKIVGTNTNFPSKQYKSAIVEVLDRYLIPRIANVLFTSSPVTDLGINKKSSVASFNSGFDSFLEYSKKYQIPLIIYLHAEKIELKNQAYNEQGQEIIRFAEKNKIPLIKDLNMGLDSSEFRDNIHINERGQQKLAQRVLRAKGI